jgi:hypothetical protein
MAGLVEGAAMTRESDGGRVRLTLVIEETHLDRLSEVVERLKRAGLQIDNVAESIGTVSGTIDEERAADIALVYGVAMVERSRVRRAPPPESELQ